MSTILHLLADTGLVVACGLAAVAFGSGLVTWVFRRVDRAEGRIGRPGTGGPETPPPPPATDDAPAASSEPAEGPTNAQTLQGAGRILRGGLWIGRLERLAVFAAIVAGYPNGLAVAVAVKALARYPELRSTDTAAAERFIIGTFVSVLWAGACAGLAHGLLTLL